MINFLDYTMSDITKAAGKNNKTVFSCFSGGGGSTMGYKLAGYDVIGNCEIDDKMNATYVANHSPKFNFNCDIRELVTATDLPNELFNLDILDGSPPCTPFSMSGPRAQSWGKEKLFREGQKKQQLDELFFDYIALADKLKPKIIVAENVIGMKLGKAKAYYDRIIDEMSNIGYGVKVYPLSGISLGVPQNRKRLFFVGIRNDEPQLFPDSISTYKFPYVNYSEIYVPSNKPVTGPKTKARLSHKIKTDHYMSDITTREENLYTNFNVVLCHRNKVLPTITTKSYNFIDYIDEAYLSDMTIIKASTFPKDYKFDPNSVIYTCGMSVPPKIIYELSMLLFGNDEITFGY